MFNDAQVSLTGYVATQPHWRGIGTPSQNVTMRVAWTPRRLDRSTGEWVDGHTSYVSVFCWRKLAENVATCLRKGDPVLVKGRLSVRDYTDKEGVPRTTVEIDAAAVGHDLGRGVAQFQRTRPATGKTADEYAAEPAAGGDDYDGTRAGGSAEFAASEFAASEFPSSEFATAETGAAELGTAVSARADAEMFDQEAIAALAADADSVPAPF